MSSDYSFMLVSSDLIPDHEVERLLQMAGATRSQISNPSYKGTLKYRQIWVRVYTNKPDELFDENEETFAQKSELLGAPPCTFITLIPSDSDIDISFQLAYDFAYLCIREHPHCLLENWIGDLISEDEIIEICNERYYSKDVPPLYQQPLQS